VANAVKFTPAAGEVRVCVSGEGGDALVAVADAGPGIAPEHHERIFERFHRVHDGGDPREGAGLGLALVAWAVRAHGGRIDLRSAPGAGSTFTVRLPRRPTPSSPGDAGEGPSVGSGAG
jgi:two-component system OmpR family sensor kinase